MLTPLSQDMLDRAFSFTEENARLKPFDDTDDKLIFAGLDDVRGTENDVGINDALPLDNPLVMFLSFCAQTDEETNNAKRFVKAYVDYQWQQRVDQQWNH